MADQPTNQNTSDEIDLGQLFQLIRKGFNKLGNFFLRVFLYLKRNAVILISLFIVGALIGYGLNFVTEEKRQVEVIVRPNLESKNYLYDVVEEIESNLKNEDWQFFGDMGIADEDLKGFEISIEPVKEDLKNVEEQMEYLETLQKFEDTGLIEDVLREEILKNTGLNHRITFLYKSENGYQVALKIIEYINSNTYFNELISIQTSNFNEKIRENQVLINQVDKLVANYTENFEQKGTRNDTGTIVLENEEQLDIRSLLDLKNALIRDTQEKRISIKEQSTPISIINFGTPHKLIKPLFGKKIVLIPTILISLFFLVSFLRYLNRKAMELERG